MSNTFDRFNSWKAMLYADKLREIVAGKLPYPVNWHIYPSNNCVYNCNFCIMKEEKKRKTQLTSDILDKVVADSTRLGIKLIHISGGGEPLTNPYIDTFVGWLGKCGIKIAMSTNGYLLEQLTNKIDHLRISFNAGKKETYKSIHSCDGFDKVIKNIRDVIKRKVAKDIGMAYVLTHQNYIEIPEFIKLADEIGVDFVHIRPAFWEEHNEEIIEATKFIRKWYDGSKKDFKINVYMVSDKFDGYWNNNKFSCRATPLYPVLSATGEFLLCQDRLDLRWGDYYKQSFEDIWFSPKHYELIEKAQLCRIRCVECNVNEIIQRVIINNEIRSELL